MSMGSGDFAPLVDHEDSLLYMLHRRGINEDFAEHPVDFNELGLWLGQQALDRTLTTQDLVVDIGASNGSMAGEAALKTGISAQLIGIEPDYESIEAHDWLDQAVYERMTLIHGVGENMPLATNSAAGATMHNVIFRAQDADRMLGEAQRVVKPGGFIAISTNALGHAHYRHHFEEYAAQRLQSRYGIKNVAFPKPPAFGRYMENLPEWLQRVGGFSFWYQAMQHTRSIITEGDRLEEYIQSLKYSAANIKLWDEELQAPIPNTSLPDINRTDWRTIIDTDVRAKIMKRIADNDQRFQLADGSEAPYFADTIYRGMVVLRNNKSS